MTTTLEDTLAKALANMTGIAEADNLDATSNVWRSAIIDANAALDEYSRTKEDERA